MPSSYTGTVYSIEVAEREPDYAIIKIEISKSKRPQDVTRAFNRLSKNLQGKKVTIFTEE